MEVYIKVDFPPINCLRPEKKLSFTLDYTESVLKRQFDRQDGITSAGTSAGSFDS